MNVRKFHIYNMYESYARFSNIYIYTDSVEREYREYKVTVDILGRGFLYRK